MRPVAVTAANAVPLWMSNVPRDGGLVNAITGVLRVPAFAFWDDALGQALYYLSGRCEDPATSADGVLDRARSILGDPLMRNFAWDPGQVSVLRDLEVVNETVNVSPFLVDPFLERGARRGADHCFNITTVGNIYVGRSGGFDMPPVSGFIEAVGRQKLSDPERPMWEVFQRELDALRGLGSHWPRALHEDQTYFWNLYAETTRRVTSHLRLCFLGGVKMPIDIVGAVLTRLASSDFAGTRA